MKKIVLMAAVLMSLSVAASAQMKFGLRFAPGLAINRVEDKKDDDGAKLSNNGAGVRFSAGVVADYFFSENVAFATGLWYTAKRAGIKNEYSALGANYTSKTVYNTQFVQLPVSLKFFTNDLNDGMKVYFQLGTTIDVKINEKLKSIEPSVTPKPSDKVFIPLDMGILLGGGIEMELSKDTKFFTGLNYNRGLFNMLKDKANGASNIKDSYSTSFDLISIEAGLKF